MEQDTVRGCASFGESLRFGPDNLDLSEKQSSGPRRAIDHGQQHVGAAPDRGGELGDGRHGAVQPRGGSRPSAQQHTRVIRSRCSRR